MFENWGGSMVEWVSDSRFLNLDLLVVCGHHINDFDLPWIISHLEDLITLYRATEEEWTTNERSKPST
jgi:hypothetical protein